MDTFLFLELSLPARDVRESLAWYLALGFGQRVTREVRSYHYAVICAGDFNIGLHAEDVPAAGLSFVRPDVARYVRQQELAGSQFEFTRLGEDQFHEAGRVDPDGSLAILMEARTFSAGADDPDTIPVTGLADRLALPCRQLKDSLEFWQHYGFMVVEPEAEGMAELHSANLTLELREGTRHATVIFKPDNLQKCLLKIEATGTPVKATNIGYELIAPEGTRLLIQ